MFPASFISILAAVSSHCWEKTNRRPKHDTTFPWVWLNTCLCIMFQRCVRCSHKQHGLSLTKETVLMLIVCLWGCYGYELRLWHIYRNISVRFPTMSKAENDTCWLWFFLLMTHVCPLQYQRRFAQHITMKKTKKKTQEASGWDELKESEL